MICCVVVVVAVEVVVSKFVGVALKREGKRVNNVLF